MSGYGHGISEYYLSLPQLKTHWHFASSIDPSLLMARAPEAALSLVYRRKNILWVWGADVSEVQRTLYKIPVMLFTFVGFFISQNSSQVLNVSSEISICSPVHAFAGKHQPSKSPAAASPITEKDSKIDNEMLTKVLARKLRIKICPN